PLERPQISLIPLFLQQRLHVDLNVRRFLFDGWTPNFRESQREPGQRQRSGGKGGEYQDMFLDAPAVRRVFNGRTLKRQQLKIAENRGRGEHRGLNRGRKNNGDLKLDRIADINLFGLGLGLDRDGGLGVQKTQSRNPGKKKT